MNPACHPGQRSFAQIRKLEIALLAFEHAKGHQIAQQGVPGKALRQVHALLNHEKERLLFRL